jgi:hypothetical protein
MTRFTALALLLCASMACAADSSRPSADNRFAAEFAPLLTARCVKCHGPEKQSGDFRLDDLAPDVGKDLARWTAVRDQLRDGLMPPAKEPRIDDVRVRAVVAWISAQSKIRPALLPNQGNLIPHELLFGKPAEAGSPPAGRVWRLSPEAYMGFVRDVTRGKAPAGLVQPFTLVPERGIRDFAGLYTIDEPSTEILFRNAEAMVDVQTARTSGVAEFVLLMDPAREPTRGHLESAIRTQFRMAIGRSPDADEVTRLIGLYEKCARDGERPAAVRTLLQAVLLRTDALFRSELGRGNAEGHGRNRLAPEELVQALSLALGDRRDAGLVAAVQKGELTTREQVAAHVRRILDDPKAEKPRLLKFFREYFESGQHVDRVSQRFGRRSSPQPLRMAGRAAGQYGRKVEDRRAVSPVPCLPDTESPNEGESLSHAVARRRQATHQVRHSGPGFEGHRPDGSGR